jgi:hypothetical protein
MGWNNSKAISSNTAHLARTIGAHANFYLRQELLICRERFIAEFLFFPQIGKEE